MLIIVSGLAAILLVLSVAFMARMRSDSQETRVVLAEAQARLMLHGALMYLQETSRLGWGDAEAFGWTDARDGGLGPRGPRPPGLPGSGDAVPPPAWWTSHPSWGPFKWNPEDADLPALSLRAGGWPCPGTATRCPMALCELPPYATQQTFAYTPVTPPVAYDSPAWSTPWDTNTSFDLKVQWPTDWIDRIFSAGGGAKGMLDPQPVADTWGAFRNGKVDASATRGDWPHEVYDASGQLVSGASQQLAVVPGTENQSWFRIYRETQADHDCVDNVGAPGTEWWDRVKIASDLPPAVPGTPKQKNWSVFIVACGAGGTRGYRFWNDADIGKWEADHGLPAGSGRALEPVTAEESGLFPDESTFRELLAATRVLWFRCEWSALQSGARTMNIYNDSMWRVGTRPWQHYLHGPQTPAYQYTAQYAKTEVKQTGDDDESDARSDSPKTYGGNIKWLQRLDRDPILW